MTQKIIPRIQHKLIRKEKKSNIHTLVMAVAVVMIRRGVWWILDKFLFPNHELISYIVGVIIGILIIYIDDKRVDELWHH